MDKKQWAELSTRLNAIRMPGPGKPKGLSYRELAEEIRRVTGGELVPSVLYRFLNDAEREPHERTLYVLEQFVAAQKPTRRGSRRGSKRSKAAAA